MRNPDFLAAALLACAACVAAAPALAGPKDTFSIREVDGPPWGEHGFQGIALNDSGQVVASLILPDWTTWYTGPDATGVVYLPPALGGLGPESLTGINNAGQVTGTYRNTGFLGAHAFVTSADGSTFSDLNPGSAKSSWVAGVDDNDTVAGTYTSADDPTTAHGFRNNSEGSRFARLGTLGGGDAIPAAIRRTRIVGAAHTADGDLHAFRTAPDNRTLVDLGTLGGTESQANAINGTGVVVGFARDAVGVAHAFITEGDGSLRQLDDAGAGFVDSVAYGIDAQGHVVGSAHDAQHQAVAFVTQAHGGRMFDLNKLTRVPFAGLLEKAVAINAKGQILADDFYDEHGPWLLTPAGAGLAEVDRR